MFGKRKNNVENDSNLKLFVRATEANINAFVRNTLKANSNDALYDIPWYITLSSEDVVSGTASFLSSCNMHNGERYMLDAQPLWKWYENNSAVYIDININLLFKHTAGDTKSDILPVIINALRKKRKLMPLNGAVLSVSMQESFGDKYKDLCRTIAHYSGKTLPVYLVVVDTVGDHIMNIREYISSIQEQQVIGHLLEDAGSLSSDGIANVYDNILKSMNDFLLGSAPDIKQDDFRRAYSGFMNIAQKKEHVVSSIITLLNASAASGRFNLRGIMLAGVKSFSQDAHSFFTEDLIRKILPAEQPVIHRINA